MASLTDMSINARRGIRYGIYLLIFGLVARFLFNTTKAIYLKIFPPSPPEPTVKYGGLPRLAFPEKATLENITYKLETPSGGFPVITTQLPVYVMPPIPSNLKALEEAQTIAGELGFLTNGKLISDSIPNVYVFQKNKYPSVFTINIVSGVFSISYDLSQDSSLFVVPLTSEVAIKQVQSYLSSADLLPADLSDGRYTYEFYKIEKGELVPVLSLSEANAIKVNVFRGNYNDLPSVTPNFPEANIWFMLGGSGSKQIIGAQYRYFPINKDENSTYPIKTAEKAWEDLQNNQAYIASYDGNGQAVTVRKVYLAYYDAGQYQVYYQPVFVFEGDDNFMAYVPAIDDKYYNQTKNEGN